MNFSFKIEISYGNDFHKCGPQCHLVRNHPKHLQCSKQRSQILHVDYWKKINKRKRGKQNPFSFRYPFIFTKVEALRRGQKWRASQLMRASWAAATDGTWRHWRQLCLRFLIHRRRRWLSGIRWLLLGRLPVPGLGSLGPNRVLWTSLRLFSALSLVWLITTSSPARSLVHLSEPRWWILQNYNDSPLLWAFQFARIIFCEKYEIRWWYSGCMIVYCLCILCLRLMQITCSKNILLETSVFRNWL